MTYDETTIEVGDWVKCCSYVKADGTVTGEVVLIRNKTYIIEIRTNKYRTKYRIARPFREVTKIPVEDLI